LLSSLLALSLAMTCTTSGNEMHISLTKAELKKVKCLRDNIAWDSHAITSTSTNFRFDTVAWSNVYLFSEIAAGECSGGLVKFVRCRSVTIPYLPTTEANIKYDFNQKNSLQRRVVPNYNGEKYWGTIVGSYRVVKGAESRALLYNNVDTAVVIGNSADLRFTNGLYLDVTFKRFANADEDGLISKWYNNADEFLLAVYPDGGFGRLSFTIVTSDGVSKNLEYDFTHDVTNTWMRASAIYKSAHMYLYVDGLKVADRAVTGSTALRHGTNSIRIGDSGIGDASNDWTNFNGIIDIVKIWF